MKTPPKKVELWHVQISLIVKKAKKIAGTHLTKINVPATIVFERKKRTQFNKKCPLMF